MNRQTKRQMQRSGADQRQRPQPQRRGAPGTETERVGPTQYLREVRSEMKKVAWPTREEVINSSVVVLVAVVVLTLVIFGFDYVSSKFVLFLYQ
jgi:preprotein translocase subunit SecE